MQDDACIVPQELAIYNDLSAEQNVSFFGSLITYQEKLEEQTKETLDCVGLYDRRKEKVKTFGGMKLRRT